MNVGLNQLNNLNINNSKIPSENIQNNSISNKSDNLFDITLLNLGELFQGEITEISNGNIAIRINEQILNARFENAVDVCVGETLNFLVKESNGNQVIISPVLPQENPFINTIYKALDEAGIPATDKNFDIAELLLKNVMPLNKETITNILSASLSFPDADVETIVLLYKYNININNENIEQMEHYKNYEHQISTGLKELSSNLPEILLKAYENGSKNDFLNIVKIINGSSSDFIENLISEDMDILKNLKMPEDIQISEKAITLENREFILKELLCNEKFKEYLKQDLRESLSIKPEDLTKEALIKLYNKLYDGLKDINYQLDFNKTISNLKSNIEFMKQINENFQFVQIPLNLGEKINQSDLYVYTNKKKKYSPKEGTSILLHLNMEFVGNIDINISIKDDNINAKFSLENMDSMDIFKDNMPLLMERLKEKGYSFKSIIEKLIKEHPNFVEYYLAADKKDMEIKRYSFDIKA